MRKNKKKKMFSKLLRKNEKKDKTRMRKNKRKLEKE